MKLPNAHRAIVEIAKVRDYCLDPIHPRGKHKARVFLASCGMTAQHAEQLREAFLRAAENLEAKPGQADDYGQRYTIELQVEGPTGAARVRSGWIVRHDEDFPRFVSCYVM